MHPIIAVLILAVLAIVLGVGIGIWLQRPVKLPPPLPTPGRTVVGVHTGETFEVVRPSTDRSGNPVNPVVRRGAFTVVWPRKTFHNHFKPK